MEQKSKVIIYSCSGCSNLAQLANHIAVKLDRDKIGKMSCVAGLGGDVAPLVKIAQESERNLIIDGCPLSCALKCFQKHSTQDFEHVVLTNYHLQKNQNTDFSSDEFNDVYPSILQIMKKLNF